MTRRTNVSTFFGRLRDAVAFLRGTPCACPACRAARDVRRGDVACCMCQRPATGMLSGAPLCAACAPPVAPTAAPARGTGNGGADHA